MVIYNAKILFIIEHKHVCINYIPWSYWDDMVDYFVLGLCLLRCKTCGTILYEIFDVVYLCLSSIWTCVLLALFFQYPYD